MQPHDYIMHTELLDDDYYSGKQDMAKHATKAKAQRHRTDARKGATKTARGVYRYLAGPFAPAMGAAAIGAGITAYRRNPQKYKNAARNAKNTVKGKYRVATAPFKAKKMMRDLNL